MRSRQQIAEELLGCVLEDGLYAPCPGIAKHSKSNGRRDFRIVLDGAPTAYCFHSSCSGEVEEFNKELRRRIWLEEHEGELPRYAPAGWEGVAVEPKADVKARPPIDREKIEAFVHGVPIVGIDWYRKRSPVDVECCDSEAFLRHLYRQGERVVIFTDWCSQGNFLFEHGRGSFRLAQQRGVKAVPSALPAGGKEGVWFLVQPVMGTWQINHKMSQDETMARWTRRSEVNVTAWRYFVLESDVLTAKLWLRVLAILPLPIAAIYTSGGRSIHALVKIQASSKAGWDGIRNAIRQLVCPLGADPAALSAVRLSRLPGCMRGNEMQRLLFLNPEPTASEIRLMPEVRG